MVLTHHSMNACQADKLKEIYNDHKKYMKEKKDHNRLGPIPNTHKLRSHVVCENHCRTMTKLAQALTQKSFVVSQMLPYI